MRNLNIKPTEALPTIKTTRAAHGNHGSFFRAQILEGALVNTAAHEYGAVRQAEFHIMNAEYDRAYTLRTTDRVLVEFSKCASDEEGITTRTAVSASMSKAEARQLRDKLNSLDLD